MKRLIVVLCLVLSPLSSLFASEDVPTLVKQLGHTSYQKREQASASLRARGPEVIPYLQKGIQSSDLEIRIRARRILSFIRAREICKPKLYTYTANKKKISVILSDLARQTGEQVYLAPGDFPDSYAYKDELAKDRIISIDAKNKTSWELLQDLCVQTKTQIELRWVDGSRRLCLITQTEKNRNPYTARGHIHVQSTNSYFSTVDNTPVYGIQLSVFGEKKRPILQGSCQARVLSAVTDKGEQLKSFPDYYYVAPDFHSTYHETHVTIARPSTEKATKCLKELRLEVSYALAGEPCAHTGLLSTLQGKKAVSVKDLRLQPLQCNTVEGITDLTVSVQRSSGRFYGHPTLEVMDTKGNRIAEAACSVLKLDTGYELHIRYPAKIGVQYRLSYFGNAAYTRETVTLKQISLR